MKNQFTAFLLFIFSNSAYGLNPGQVNLCNIVMPTAIQGAPPMDQPCPKYMSNSYFPGVPASNQCVHELYSCSKKIYNSSTLACTIYVKPKSPKPQCFPQFSFGKLTCNCTVLPPPLSNTPLENEEPSDDGNDLPDPPVTQDPCKDFIVKEKTFVINEDISRIAATKAEAEALAKNNSYSGVMQKLAESVSDWIENDIKPACAILSTPEKSCKGGYVYVKDSEKVINTLIGKSLYVNNPEQYLSHCLEDPLLKSNFGPLLDAAKCHAIGKKEATDASSHVSTALEITYRSTCQ